MKRYRKSLLVAAAFAIIGTGIALPLLLAPVPSSAQAPFRNGPNQISQYVQFDSIRVATGHFRTIHLFGPATAGAVVSNPDSIYTLWFNGGAAPPIRRINGLWVNTAGTGVYQFTFFNNKGTSANMTVELNGFTFFHLPIEADSIKVRGVNAPNTLTYVLY